MYEKYINVNHRDRKINSLYKLYYLGENYVGSSVDFGRGVGLIALLKRICDGVQFGPLKGDIHLYFSDDKKMVQFCWVSTLLSGLPEEV